MNEKNISDIQAGKAGEYLVCADLILKGYVAYPSEQGLHYDLVFDYEGKLFRIQVKTTRKPLPTPQRKIRTEKYLFHIRRCGKKGRQHYSNKDIDIIAIVALDTKTIGYIPINKTKQTMFFIPEGGFSTGKCKCKKISDYKIEDCIKAEQSQGKLNLVQ